MLVLVSSAARAQVTKAFEFDVPGLPPTQDSEMRYCPGGGALLEPDAFQAPGDGFLHQNLQDRQTAHLYSFGPDCDIRNGPLDPGQSFSIEARLQCSGIVQEGAVLQVGNGMWRYKITLTEQDTLRVFTPTGGQNVAVDLSQPHTFRIESPGNSPQMSVYVDGSLVVTADAIASDLNFFHWGGGAQSPPSTANCTWDYVRFHQPSSDATPPVLFCPSSVFVIDRLDMRGEHVAFPVAATDDRDPSPDVVCVPPSGSLFPPGTTLVTCTATDTSGNQSLCMFPVTVQTKARRH